jgi:WhiB family redox-sensing transcriptional regulator
VPADGRKVLVMTEADRAPLGPRGSWWVLAACQTADPELFIRVSGSGPAVADLAGAKAVCASCGVRAACLTYAVQTRQAYGVWGGCSEEERRALTTRRQRELTGQVG